MAFKMKGNPFKQWEGGKPPKKHSFSDEEKVWCKEAGKWLTQEACEDAKGLDTNVKTPKVHKDGRKTDVSGHDLGKDPHWQPHQFKNK